MKRSVKHEALKADAESLAVTWLRAVASTARPLFKGRHRTVMMRQLAEEMGRESDC
jgi:hypothetical protein